jgi:hypothetical protein
MKGYRLRYTLVAKLVNELAEARRREAAEQGHRPLWPR